MESGRWMGSPVRSLPTGGEPGPSGRRW